MLALVALSTLGGLAVLGLGRVAGAGARAAQAHAAYVQQCPEPYSAGRDRSNPLALPTPPGPNPLNGARFFVDGPTHGAAAGAIAQLMGLNPTALPDDESWARLDQGLQSGPL